MAARIVFVCQQGRLETQGLLLAASLRLHFPHDCKLIAAWPSREGELSGETQAALASLDVEVAEIQNPMAADYLIGHKLAALALVQGDGPGLFLDSDMIAMRSPGALPQGLAAVPASSHHCGLNTWQYLYERFDLDMPAEGPATLLSQDTIAPYFNSGLVSVAGADARAFADCWTDCARRIDTDPLVPAAAKRPYLDQVALPIAAALLQRDIAVLEEAWNYRGWGFALEDEADPILYHYQDPVRLGRADRSAAAAHAAKSVTPAVAQALRELEF